MRSVARGTFEQSPGEKGGWKTGGPICRGKKMATVTDEAGDFSFAALRMELSAVRKHTVS